MILPISLVLYGGGWSTIATCDGCMALSVCRHSHPPTLRGAETPCFPKRASPLVLPHLEGGWSPPATCEGCMAVSLRSPLVMARRNVRSSVRTQSRTEQVCGAKQRFGHAVSPLAGAEATIYLHPFWCARSASTGDQPAHTPLLLRSQAATEPCGLPIAGAPGDHPPRLSLLGVRAGCARKQHGPGVSLTPPRRR